MLDLPLKVKIKFSCAPLSALPILCSAFLPELDTFPSNLESKGILFPWPAQQYFCVRPRLGIASSGEGSNADHNMRRKEGS